MLKTPNKIALITDTHFGEKNDSPYFFEYFNKFLENIFFPSLLKNNIKQVLFLGDVWSRRRFINFNTLSWARKNFFDKLHQYNIKMDIICGNHDVYYKNTNSLNSLDLLVDDYPNVTIYTKPVELTIGQTTFLLVPWINEENEKSTFKTISKSSADVMLCHMDIIGFDMIKGMKCSSGYDRKLFKKFKKVLSGHFHVKSCIDNVMYLGCPWDLNFADYNLSKGFYYMNTNTTDLEFVPNPYKMFKKIEYNDKKKTKKQIFGSSDLKLENIENCHVKIVVVYKKNIKWFNMFVDKIYENKPISLNVIETYQHVNIDEGVEKIDLSMDTFEIVKNSLEDYQNNLFDVSHTVKITEILKTLYIDAQNMN